MLSVSWHSKETAFQSRADHSPIGYTHPLFCLCDLDLDPMTLIYETDIAILKMYLQTKTNFLGQVFQKLEHYRQTDKRTDR